LSSRGKLRKNMRSEKAINCIKKDPNNPKTSYVVIDELPKDQIPPFSVWILGMVTPVVDIEEHRYGPGTMTPYSWDYEMWYDYWSKGAEAPKEEDQQVMLLEIKHANQKRETWIKNVMKANKVDRETAERLYSKIMIFQGQEEEEEEWEEAHADDESDQDVAVV
jgi:hypothetical protein